MANLSTVPEVVKSCQSLIESWMPSIKDMLPRHVTPERMLRIARSMIANTPKLAQCTPLSLMTALADCSLLGLEPNTPLGYCWILPFADQAVLIPGYKGYLELMYRNERVRGINAHAVRQGDFFDYDEGTAQFVKFKKATGDRGPLIAAFGHATINGAQVVRVMTAEEVLAHKRASKAVQQGKKDSPWLSEAWEHTMWQKTVLLDLAKLVPKSREIGSLMEYDNRDQGFRSGDTIVEELTANSDGTTRPLYKAPTPPADRPLPTPTTTAPATQTAPPQQSQPAQQQQPQAPPQDQPKAANKRPVGRPRKDAQAATGPTPPDSLLPVPPAPESDIPFTEEQFTPPEEAEDPEHAKTRLLFLAQIEKFRAELDDPPTEEVILAKSGHRTYEVLKKEMDTDRLQQVGEWYGVAIAEKKAALEQESIPQESNQPSAGEAITIEQLVAIGADVKAGKVPPGERYALKDFSVKLVGFNPVDTTGPKGKTTVTKALIGAGDSRISAYFYEAPPNWLNIGRFVKIPSIQVLLSKGEPFYKIEQWAGQF